MRAWNRGPDRDVEAQLRANRPEPSPELTSAIADRVRPRRSVLSGLARVPVGLAAGVSAIVVTVALALGAGSAVTPAQDTSNLRSQAKAAAIAPASHEYDEDVTICVYGFATHEVDADSAATLVALGVAEYGPCGGFFGFRR